MAITIDSSPSSINAAYRAVKWQVSSNDGTIVGIRADLYINGTYSTTLEGVQELGTTDTFNFDIRKVMQSDLKSELRTNITAADLTDATLSCKTVKMRFFEVLLTAGVNTTTWAADGAGTGYVESGNVDVINAAIQHQESLSDYTVDDATKKLLTTRGNNTTIPKGVPFQIGFLTADTNLYASIVELDQFGNTLNSVTTPVIASMAKSMGIIEIPASSFADANTKYVDIKLIKNAVGDRSLTYRFIVVENCSPFPIFFQNHLGSIDHFDFGLEKTENISTKTQTIKKPLPDGFSSEDVGTSVVSSTVSSKIKVKTPALSDADLTYLANLIKNHSVVYKWDSAATFLSYIVKSHSTKISDNVKLINNVSLTLAPSNEHITQLGD